MAEYNLRGAMRQALTSGILDNLPPEEKKKLTGLITYLLSEDAVEGLETTIESIGLLSKYATQLSQDGYVLGNLGCAAGGLIIGGVSTQNYFQTSNRVAKIFYGSSILCSGTAMVAGSVKAASGVCGLSHVALAGDVFGGSCLFLGNRARELGSYVEGRASKKGLNPFRPKKFVRQPKKGIGYGYKGLSFVPYSTHSVSFQKIVIIGGTIFTIYCYGKTIIAVYKYINSKAKAWSKKNQSQAIYLRAQFLTNSLKYNERVQRIYHVASYPMS